MFLNVRRKFKELGEYVLLIGAMVFVFFMLFGFVAAVLHIAVGFAQ